MITDIRLLFTLYLFSTGRRLFIYNQVESALQAVRNTAIMERLQWARAFDLETRRQEAAWRRWKATKSSARGRASDIDNRIDRIVSGIFNSVGLLLRTLPPASPEAERARAFLAEFFPEGAEAITGAEFEEALSIITEMNGGLAALTEDELKGLNIAAFVPQLVALTPDFRRELERTTARVSYKQLAKARRRGQDRLCCLVATIVSEYPDDEEPESLAARTALLTPVVDQNERVRETKARHPGPDVELNPETGEELDRDALDALDEELDRPVTPTA